MNKRTLERKNSGELDGEAVDMGICEQSLCGMPIDGGCRGDRGRPQSLTPFIPKIIWKLICPSLVFLRFLILLSVTAAVVSNTVFADDGDQQNSSLSNNVIAEISKENNLNNNKLHNQSSFVQDVNKDRALDFIQQIDGIFTTQTATVVAIPPYWTFRVKLNEGTLKKVGCTFNTSNPLHITDLFEVLKRADVEVSATTNSFEMHEPREGIFLTLANGGEVKFLFDRKYVGENNIRGAFSHSQGSIRFLRVTASQSLLQELLLWAARTGPPVSNDAQGQSICEQFMKSVKLN